MNRKVRPRKIESASQPLQLDATLHQPVRTRIVAFLVARGEATFTELKQALDVTDGNLEAHLKKITEANYLSTHKESGHGRPQTLYSLTDEGKTAFRQYLTSLQKLLSFGDSE